MTKTVHAFNRVQDTISTILGKLNGINKSSKKFFIHLMPLFLNMRGRYNFLNMARHGNYCEQSYRNHFEKNFDFLELNVELINQSCSAHRIIAFDPSYIPKSGKHTDHLGWFWSGASGKALKGLELGGLALIDIENNTAMSLEAVQTPSRVELEHQDMTLVDHYAKLIVDRKEKLMELSDYLAVDGYFSKQKFVETVTNQTNLHIVSKQRNDANLRYLFHGVHKKQKGRPKQYDGKIDVKNIDKRRIRLEYEQDNVKVYGGIVWSTTLKRKIKIAYVDFWKKGMSTERYAILFSTDLNLDAKYIYLYYKSRFQIEFLYRDAKQYCGLNHCQGRSENKLHFHFNASLTAVTLAKSVYHLNVEKEKRGAFSLSDIKTMSVNKKLTDRIFSNLEIDMSCKKIKQIYQDALLFGCRMARAA